MVGHLKISKIINSKITFLLTINTPNFLQNKHCSRSSSSSSSLWPCRTIEKGLRLRSRHPRVSEKASNRPGQTPSHHLWPGTLTPLEDEQGSDEDPEEEVDPGCRLEGRRHRGDIKVKIWAFTDGKSEILGGEKASLTSALYRLL